MCLTGSLLRSVLVVLIVANCCGKRRCNYKEIREYYREVIFVELQNLNLTGSATTFKEKDPCPSGKERRILVSIYGMTHQILCQKSGNKSDLEKPVESMEQLIIQNCSPNYMAKKTSCSAVRQIKGNKRKRLRLIRVIKQLITCWEKLLSIHVLAN